MRRSLKLAVLSFGFLAGTIPQAAGAQHILNTTKSNTKDRAAAVEAGRTAVAVQVFDANGRPTDKSALTPAQRARIDRVQSAVQDSLGGDQPSNFWFEIDCRLRPCRMSIGFGDPPRG